MTVVLGFDALSRQKLQLRPKSKKRASQIAYVQCHNENHQRNVALYTASRVLIEDLLIIVDKIFEGLRNKKGGMIMLALEGIRILDLSRLAPGPYCTMILADLGADVLKIEPPGSDIPFFAPPVEEDRWCAYNAHDRNKRSIVLNLKTEEGRQIFYNLSEGADVVVEGFRPGAVKRLGVDYDTLKINNPRIIYCSISGYGQHEPYSYLPGHDPNYIAVTGALSLIGPKDKAPSQPPNWLADFAGGGLQASVAVLAALIARERTGMGQYLDVAMLDGVMSLMASEMSQYFISGKVPKRGETWNTGGEPWSGVYETKDGGYITVAAGEPHFWQNLCKALGCDDLLPYQNATGEKRMGIFQRFKKAFLLKKRDEWFDLLIKADVPVGPVYSLEEAVGNEHILHRRMVIEVEHQKFGIVRQVGIIPSLSETPGQVRHLGVKSGEHTAEVLTSLGYRQEDIDRLRRKGVIW